MNTKTLALVTISLLVTAVASADSHTPGSKGTVTAYESDEKTVIRVDGCPAKKLAFDYPTCGKKLREDVAEMMCKRGKGTHKWWYQIADGKPMAQSTACK